MRPSKCPACGQSWCWMYEDPDELKLGGLIKTRPEWLDYIVFP